jgi:hypothetical protein
MSRIKDLMTKSKAAKEAKSGKGDKEGKFDKVADKASKEYGSKVSGEKVAGAIFKRMHKDKC